AMCVLRDEIPELESTRLQEMINQDVLPVLSGDVVFDEKGGIHVFSSDRVPEILSSTNTGNLRVVTLTDVDGIVVDGEGGDRILPHIDARSPEDAYAALWKSNEWDATGAMHTKLDAMITCARRGADCFIMRSVPGIDLDRDLVPESTYIDKADDTIRGKRFRSGYYLVHYFGEPAHLVTVGKTFYVFGRALEKTVWPYFVKHILTIFSSDHGFLHLKA